MILTGETEVLGEEPVPVPLGRLKFPHALVWNRNPASGVKVNALVKITTLQPINYQFILAIKESAKIKCSGM